MNRFYSVRNGELGTKHIFAGETRVLSKLVKTPPTVDANTDYGDFPGSKGILNALGRGRGNKFGIFKRLDREDTTLPGTLPVEKDQFYYHTDHLGNSNIITDIAGSVYQHLEYFPYGEPWIEEGGSYGGNTPPYKFTGKELDPETGLYYFGARYYDPVLAKWINADPLFDKYLPWLRDRKGALPGFGGVYTPINLAVYTYSQANPVILRDPDGRHTTGNHYKILEASLVGEYAASDYTKSLMKYMTKSVDAWKYQGTEVRYTSLHGMAGIHRGKMQKYEDAVKSTEATIEKLISKAAEYAKDESYVEAIALLGAATHVVQDELQHKHREWKGFWRSILNPIGLLIHWIRDLFLGKEELVENVQQTQKQVFDKYREMVGEERYKTTMQYGAGGDKPTTGEKERAIQALERVIEE